MQYALSGSRIRAGSGRSERHISLCNMPCLDRGSVLAPGDRKGILHNIDALASLAAHFTKS